MPQPKIKVFWDLGTCPPPPSYDGSPWDLLKAIRLFTFRFGVVSSFKAYGDRNVLPRSYAGSLQAAMTSMGITVVDCSLVQEYNRDTLARTLAVEVLVSAIDDPINLDGREPDIIMIFSGDKSILHPISLLMLRGYTIYLVIPNQTDQVESSRATRVFIWNTDVLDLKSRSPESASVLSTRQSSPARSGVGVKVGDTGSKYFQPPNSPRSAGQRASAPFPMSLNSLEPTISPARTKLKAIPASPEPSSSRVPSALSLVSDTQLSTFKSPPSGKMRASLAASPEKNPGDLRLEDVNENWGMDSGWNEGGGWGAIGSEWTAEPKKQPIDGATHTTGMAIAHLYPEPSPVPVPRDYDPRSGSPGVDDSVFLPLLQFLNKAQAEGKHPVLRSVVGSELSKNKDIYGAAGTTGFSTYIALAASKGIITLGGTGGKDWVALK